MARLVGSHMMCCRSGHRRLASSCTMPSFHVLKDDAADAKPSSDAYKYDRMPAPLSATRLPSKPVISVRGRIWWTQFASRVCSSSFLMTWDEATLSGLAINLNQHMTG